MKMMKRLHLITLCASLLFTGCLGENRNDCPPEDNLTLAFTYPDFHERISCVTVGIYNNATGLLEVTKRVAKSDLELFQGTRLMLRGGDYTAIYWGNDLDNNRIDGFAVGDSLIAQEVANPGYFTSDSISTNDALYYGAHSFTKHENVSEYETVELIPAYIKLIIQIEGLSSISQELPDGNYPYIKVNNLLPAYNYNMVPRGDPVTYYPNVTVDTANRLAEAQLNVLRFEADNPVTIDVVENKTTDKVLHTVHLCDFIVENKIEIVDGKEVAIPLLIHFGGDNETIVTVTVIDGWGVLPVDPIPQK